jgi:hypothetical protein
MKALPIILTLLWAVPAVAQSQSNGDAVTLKKAGPYQPGPTAPLPKGAPHDPWDIDAASPNRNLSDSIGTTSKQAPRQDCSSTSAPCPKPSKDEATKH